MGKRGFESLSCVIIHSIVYALGLSTVHNTLQIGFEAYPVEGFLSKIACHEDVLALYGFYKSFRRACGRFSLPHVVSDRVKKFLGDR